MLFEYKQEILEELKAQDLQELLKTDSPVGIIVMNVSYRMDTTGTVEDFSVEIRWVETIESEVPVYLTEKQKELLRDYVDWDIVEAECYINSESLDDGYGY